MTHPRDRGLALGTLDRRRFLLLLAAGVPFSAAVLAACRNQQAASAGGSPIPLARPGHPVELPLFASVPKIASGLSPEANAEFRVYGWAPSYVSPKLFAAFEQKYGCKVTFVSFRSIDEAVARLRTGTLEADIFFPTLKVLGTLAAAQILQPLNHSYLPNLQTNIWPQLADPFYDKGSRYTVPYFVWTTGISWRNDIVETDVPSMQNPYDIFWDPSLRGHVHLLDSVQDVIGMTLLHRGVDNVNEENPALVLRAKGDLLDLVDAVWPSFDITDYRDLFSGEAHVHQSWSGDMTYARHYAPKPSDIKKLSYWWPRAGLIGSDTMTVLANSKNPVLAHAFIDFMLDSKNAFVNSIYNGYQAPVGSVTPERLVDSGSIPPNLRNIIVEPGDFATGKEELELSPAADSLWHASYTEVLAAARRTQGG